MQLLASQSCSEPVVVRLHPGATCVEGDLGSCAADRRRKVTVDRREHAAPAQQPRDLSQRGGRLHPMQRLTREHDVGTLLGQAGRVGPPVDVRQPGVVGLRLCLAPHVLARFHADDRLGPPRRPSTREAGAAAEVDDRRPIGAGVRAEDLGEHVGRSRSHPVVEVGEAAEPLGVRAHLHRVDSGDRRGWIGCRSSRFRRSTPA